MQNIVTPLILLQRLSDPTKILLRISAPYHAILIVAVRKKYLF